MELCKYPCKGKTRYFKVRAIQIPIVYNKYGDHDPNGLLYVLEDDAERIQKEAIRRFNQTPPQPYEEVQPLVLRVNLGDTVKICFRHNLDRRLSIHVQGLSYDVAASDGTSTGFNPDSTTSREIVYTWYADTEGVFLFHDMADPRSSEDATNIHGLFGAVIVEPPMAKWFDPETGEELESGLMADIYQPGRPAFREYSVFFHDELEILDKDGNPPMDHRTGLPASTTAISYRSEPMRNRMPLTHDPADSGEDISMSSWVYGDPAPPILRAYVGDPSKIRLIHGGIKETHVFHLHNHQWRLEPENPVSTVIDSISISPQECYTLDILYGAGSLNGVIGDVIFHCHLYPHFHEGMWTLWRIHDRLEDGTGKLPDGTPIPPLQPLKDRKLPPKKDALHPGYPNFLQGKAGEPPLQPSCGVLDTEGNPTVCPTPLERANFAENAVPGALFTETCPCHTVGECKEPSENCEKEYREGYVKECAEESLEECHEENQENCSLCPLPDTCDKVKVFEIAMVQAKITYNSYGWHDPEGRFFVLKEELERHGGLESYIRKIENQEIQAEPLVIRANAGDCIELRTTNLLPEFLEANAFQLRTRTDIVGHHVHLVKFDTIVADGAANGWNNIAGARKYETLVERFFADEELRTVFFHDHLFANSHQQHGMFGALIIEEEGATFHDIRTGEELPFGTKAVIRRKDGTSFREFALFVHDFALLFDKDGNPLNPPEVPGSHDDPGVMGINYRSEPMRERLKECEDPAYIFSSLVHGDPATPVLETYPGDELMIRLLDGAHEEQHALNITGMSWRKEVADERSPLAASQSIGISEAFNLNVKEPYLAGDYLYYFGGIDDAWLGLWGIIRAYDKYQECLKPLCKGKNRILPLPLCPGKDDVVRKYEIAAVQTDLVYNRYGDHDPDGLIFVPLEDVDLVLSGKYTPKPLILRANAGDWLEVILHNVWDPNRPIPYFDYPKVPLDKKHKPSERVSLNPQFLRYDPVSDGGINVGYNAREQTVGIGESKRYLWYADREYGACLLQSFGDMRNHRYHGLFGAVIIEPAGADWYRNFTKKKDPFAEQAVITAPGVSSFREYVLFIQNGIRLLDAQGNLIQTAQAGSEEPVDAEDTGEKGYNYRSERFANRLKRDPRVWKVFSSRVHGDPSTPIWKAYPGDRVIFRTMMPADKPRNVSLAVHGHLWREQPEDAFSREIPIQGAISIGNRFDMELKDGAGCPGDYLYRSGSFAWDVESGMWGIFRVMKQSIGRKCRGICGKLFSCIK
ncbi:MAG: multicopper oxidase domain-containing protein [Eubacteriales bacterium]|nr:multicopper oxidase domain-containing protein [Eubacteriales bacterium]